MVFKTLIKIFKIIREHLIRKFPWNTVTAYHNHHKVCLLPTEIRHGSCWTSQIKQAHITTAGSHGLGAAEDLTQTEAPKGIGDMNKNTSKGEAPWPTHSQTVLTPANRTVLDRPRHLVWLSQGISLLSRFLPSCKGTVTSPSSSLKPPLLFRIRKFNSVSRMTSA